MKDCIQIAIKALEDTLSPVPQEINELDWKSDISDKNVRLSNHLSAFANHPGGGYIVFGIDNKTGSVIGIDKSKIDNIVERLSNLSRDNLNPQVKLDHAVCDFREQPILIIHIKESSVKPVHIKSGTIEDTYIRTGGSTRKATRQEVGSLMLNSKSPRWEELLASKLEDENEVLNLLDYRAVLGLLGKPIPSSNKEILDWLAKEKMIEKIDDAGYYITNFGAITSAGDIRKFDDLARKSIRVIKYKGVNKLHTEQEFSGTKGYAIGFSGLITFLKAMLPHSEIIKNALRRETSVYPEIALRELIANALVHQDFSIRGSSVMIEIYQDRIEISNPGRLLPSKKIDRLIGTNPESRNEILASAMRRFHICEERGSGFIKAVTQIELFGLPPLAFEEGENYFKVVMHSPKPFSKMTPEERIEACYQHTVLKYFSGTGMTNTTLRERLKISERGRTMVSKVIREAIELGKIKSKDNRENKTVKKFAEYVPFWA